MLEKEIERELVRRVREMGGVCLKQTGMVGIPDRLVMMPDGKCGFVELKAPGEKPRKLQELRIKQLRKLGFKCFVVDAKNQIFPVLYAIAKGDELL